MLGAESERIGRAAVRAASSTGEGWVGRECVDALRTWSRVARHALVAALLVAPVMAGASMASDTGNECPPGLIDQPTLTRHLDQADIAKGKHSFKEIFGFGRQLFITNFNACDGAGRPGTNGAAGLHGVGDDRPLDPLMGPRFTGNSGPDSNSCASCHNEPGVGGTTSFRGNLFDPAADCEPVAAVTTAASIHQFPTANVPRPCRPVTPTVSDGFFNLFTERGSLGLFGSGAIELLGREMTQDMWAQRDAASAQAQMQGQDVMVDLVTKGVHFGKLVAHTDGSFDTSGVEGVTKDLVVRPFGRKGQNKSLRHFSLTAFNRHLGMQPDEALEQVPGDPDPDKDGFERELTIGDITAAMVFQAALPVPRRANVKFPESVKAARGEGLFSQVGCAGCHMPALPLKSTIYCEPNPLNTDGDFRDTSQSYCFDLQKTSGLKGKWVFAYTDLKRHSICDPTRDYDPETNHFCDDPPRTVTPGTDGTGPGEQGGPLDRPPYHQFLTAKLWDTGNSAPWGHRNDLDTLYEAIVAHGGEATASRDMFEALSDPDQLAIVIFLKTLRMPVMDDNPAPQEEGSPRAPNPGALDGRADPWQKSR